MRPRPPLPSTEQSYFSYAAAARVDLSRETHSVLMNIWRKPSTHMVINSSIIFNKQTKKSGLTIYVPVTCVWTIGFHLMLFCSWTPCHLSTCFHDNHFPTRTTICCRIKNIIFTYPPPRVARRAGVVIVVFSSVLFCLFFEGWNNTLGPLGLTSMSRNKVRCTVRGVARHGVTRSSQVCRGGGGEACRCCCWWWWFFYSI